MKKIQFYLLLLVFGVGYSQQGNQSFLNLKSGYLITNPLWETDFYTFHLGEGVSFEASYEIELKKKLNFSSGIGYNRKNYQLSSIPFLSNYYTDFVKNESLLFHEITFGNYIKYSPFNSKNKLYLIGGVRPNFTVKYRDILIKNTDGSEYTFFNDQISEFNRLTIDGRVGGGINLKSGLTFEFGTSRLLSRRSKNKQVNIKELSFDLSMGVRIGQKRDVTEVAE